MSAALAIANDQQRQATAWAAGTLRQLGCTLHVPRDSHGNTLAGWDVERPDGSWIACYDSDELCQAARAALVRS